MQRLVPFFAFLLFGVNSIVPRCGEAATVPELLSQARQAQARVREIKSRGWGIDEKQDVIQLLGPIALSFLSAPDLAQAASNSALRSQVHDLYETLSDPLEEIYNGSISRLEGLSKAVMDRDGDLEALYETKEWKEAQIVASQSLYFLNWLHYVGSFVSESAQRKKLLEEAAKGFSEFAVGEQSSQLKRESLFGRALCEKELKQFDWAIRDFELLLKDSGLPTDMERRVRTALAEARTRDARGERASATGRAESEADAQARAMLQRAQSLFESRKKASGTERQKQLLEAVALLDELRKRGGSWKEKADALASAEISEQEAVEIDEARNPFPAWGQARELLQKSEYAKAVPFLREVLASTDPKAVMRQREAQYYLGVGLFQQRDYREAVTQLGKFLSADGASAQLTQEATYLRFKATEALYAKDVSDENARLYLDTIKDFIRRYPSHKSIFEAYFRLGEYNQKQQQYLPAVDAYQKVSGDPTFRVRADFATLQSYFALLDTFDGQDGKQNGAGISEPDLRQRIAPSLQTFWKDTADLEKNNPNEAKLVPLHEYRGKVSVMNAVFLSKGTDAKAPEILTLLQEFEKKYPEQKEAFAKVTRMRLVALQKTGRYTDLEQEVQNVFTHFKPEEQPELLAGLTQVLPKDLKKLEKKNDRDNLLAIKRTLARLYADRLQRGEAFAEDESPERFKYDLAQLYLDVKDYDKAASMYQELQHGAYSLVALAGLAQIAAVKGEQRQAISLWEEMLKGTQVGDPLWFRGTFEVAQLHTTLGNADLACKTISGTRPLLGRLGEQGLKKKIQDLTTQSCGK